MSTYQTREQERAAYAWERVNDAAKTRTDTDFESYKQLLQGLPVSIHTLGLGQTVALYRAKGTAPHLRALADLAGWLLKKHGGASGSDAEQGKALMAHLQGLSAEAYGRETLETHHVLAWLKRFSDALAKDIKREQEAEKEASGEARSAEVSAPSS